LYSWPSIGGFSIITGIIIWSYINNILFILYSSLGLFTLCVAMLRIYAYRKEEKYNGGWNGLSLMVILYPFVFLIVGVAAAYLLYEKYGH
jgi:hypothetical protein